MCATHPRWQTQANCDAFRVFHCHSLCCQHFRPWSRCRPCLKHLRCGLACEAKQTALNEIRLDEHDWSQTSNLRSLACLRGTGFCHLAGTKRELALRFASSTYFISAGSIKESLIRREGKRGGFGFLFWWCWWSVVASFYRKKTKKPPPGSHVFLHQWPRQDKLFLFCSRFLSCHFIREWVGVLWAGCQVKSSVMTMYQDEIRSQGDVILEAVSLAWLFVSPPHLAWIVARACATFHQISGLVVLYWFAKVFQHKSFNTASTLSRLDFALYPLADGAQTSIRPPSPPCCGVFLKGRLQWTRRDSANTERSSEVLCALMWPGQ